MNPATGSRSPRTRPATAGVLTVLLLAATVATQTPGPQPTPPGTDRSRAAPSGAGTNKTGANPQGPQPQTQQSQTQQSPQQSPAPTRPEAQGQPPQSVGVGRTTLDGHDEATSRELFSACDRDSDDRLDLFEASDALETLGDPKDPRGFLKLDSTRDGYIQWPEFDAVFRRTIERSGAFRVRTCRRFVKQAPEQQEARQATPLEVFVKLHDQNENGGLDPDEITNVVREIKLNPAFEPQLRMLDVDQSGRVEASELAPVFDQIRKAVTLPGVEALPLESTMPPPWRDIDANGDGAIDLAELNSALRRLDPGLARWAPSILAQLDKDGDQKLGTAEISGATGRAPGTGNPAGSGSAARAGAGKNGSS